MEVYKWNNNRLVECYNVEKYFTFWASCVQKDWENFHNEHKSKSIEEQYELINNILKSRYN